MPVPALAKVYEDRAEDCTRAAEQTDDPVFRTHYSGNWPRRKKHRNNRGNDAALRKSRTKKVN